jgi:hypothetical protein
MKKRGSPDGLPLFSYVVYQWKMSRMTYCIVLFERLHCEGTPAVVVASAVNLIALKLYRVGSASDYFHGGLRIESLILQWSCTACPWGFAVP